MLQQKEMHWGLSPLKEKVDGYTQQGWSLGWGTQVAQDMQKLQSKAMSKTQIQSSSAGLLLTTCQETINFPILTPTPNKLGVAENRQPM